MRELMHEEIKHVSSQAFSGVAYENADSNDYTRRLGGIE